MSKSGCKPLIKDEADEFLGALDKAKAELDYAMRGVGSYAQSLARAAAAQAAVQTSHPTPQTTGISNSPWSSLLGMGVGMAAARIPVPDPAVQFVGGDHPWQAWRDTDEHHGVIEGVVFRDIFIPHFVINAVLAAARRDAPDWPRYNLEQRREHIYLEARKRLITGK